MNTRSLVRQDPLTGAYHTVDPSKVSVVDATLNPVQNYKNYDMQDNGVLSGIGD